MRRARGKTSSRRIRNNKRAWVKKCEGRRRHWETIGDGEGGG